MKKIYFIISAAILGWATITSSQAQTNLGSKKTSDVDSVKRTIKSTSHSLNKRPQLEVSNSTVVPVSSQIHTPIRWYAIENAENPRYWEGVNTSRIWLELEIGASIDAPEIASFLANFGLTNILKESRYKELTNYWIFENQNVSSAQVVEMAVAARAINGVVFLEPSVIYRQSYVPNDPLWNSQWGPYASYFDEAWEYGRGGNSQNVVAVMDNACDWNHEDLYDQVWYGFDYVYDTGDISPAQVEHNHGTHVAGTVAATIGNSIGVAGMVNDTLYFAKVGDDQDQLVDQAIVDGIYDIATYDRITVLNMSLGGDSPSAAIEQACNTAWNNGKLLLVSSGNNGLGSISFPAAYESCVAVGSVGADGNNLYLASYSQYGNEQEICGTGGDEDTGYGILSTLPGNQYGTMQGTSMAAPHVTGLAGLMKSLNPNITNVDIRNILAATAFDMGDQGWDIYYGYGLINAVGAVEAALGVSTGTNDFTTDEILSLYPNPSGNRIFLDMKGVIQTAQIGIYDITGKRVKAFAYNGQQKIEVSTAELESGVYVLNLNSDKGVYSARFVKL